MIPNANPPGWTITERWHDPESDTYTKRHPMRGAGRAGRSIAEGNLGAMRVEFPGWTKARHFEAFEYHSNRANEYRDTWDATVQLAAYAAWGRAYHPTDYRISGIASYEFGKGFQDILRRCAHAESAHRSALYMHLSASRSRMFPRGTEPT